MPLDDARLPCLILGRLGEGQLISILSGDLHFALRQISPQEFERSTGLVTTSISCKAVTNQGIDDTALVTHDNVRTYVPSHQF